MVRLKGKCNNYRKITEKISIPYGAIKSLCKKDILDKIEKFQFLMVRLKEFCS